jgi:hypothetical protein
VDTITALNSDDLSTMANDDALSRLPTSTMLPSDSRQAMEIIVFTDQLDDPLRKVMEIHKKTSLDGNMQGVVT